jgi:hypothetical protein
MWWRRTSEPQDSSFRMLHSGRISPCARIWPCRRRDEDREGRAAGTAPRLSEHLPGRRVARGSLPA